MSLLRRQRGNRQKDLVGFEIGDVSYAVDIHRVREILNPLPMVNLPNSPPSVVGVADHRGEVVPVIDLRHRLGLPSLRQTRRTKWVIVDRAGTAVGLLVDAVTDVFGAHPSQRREVPTLGRENRQGINAVYAGESGLVFVLDVDAATEVTAELDLPDSLDAHAEGR